MFTITQEAKINAYFKMVTGRLKELYDLCEKDPSSNKVIIKNENEGFVLSVNDSGVIFYYQHQVLPDMMKYIKYMDSAAEKHVATDESESMVFFYTEGGNINNFYIGAKYDSQLLTISSQLTKFNYLVENYKRALDAVFKKLSDIKGMDVPSFDDFSIPEGIIKEQLELDDSVEKIIAAAILMDGKIVIGRDHSDCGRNIGNDLYKIVIDENADYSRPEFGYITSKGVFVDPNKCWEIANRNGLVSENVQCFGKYSEDFYRACGTHFDLPEARAAIIRHYKKDVQTLNRKKKDVEVN